MSDLKIGVFPASGGLGGSTLKHLLNVVNPSSVIAIVRKPENVPTQITSTGVSVRAADFDVESTLSNAFDNISTLNLISYASIDHHHRAHVRQFADNSAIFVCANKAVCRFISSLLMQLANPGSSTYFIAP